MLWRADSAATKSDPGVFASSRLPSPCADQSRRGEQRTVRLRGTPRSRVMSEARDRQSGQRWDRDNRAAEVDSHVEFRVGLASGERARPRKATGRGSGTPRTRPSRRVRRWGRWSRRSGCRRPASSRIPRTLWQKQGSVFASPDGTTTWQYLAGDVYHWVCAKIVNRVTR